ncbi:MAG: hypothetical protein KA712_08205 [Myxococcales bacterium]|nr:hypothetical protein [Myxococcales bacterium]
METRESRTKQTHTQRRGPAKRVANLCSASFVQVPPWFTVAAARKVAQAKRVDHVLVEQTGGQVGLVALDALEGAPGHHMVSRWATPTRAEVSPQASRAEAATLMEVTGSHWLPVRLGAVLVGVITRSCLTERRPEAVRSAA